MSPTAHVIVSIGFFIAALAAVFALGGSAAISLALSQVKPSAVILIAVLLAAGVGLSSLRLKLIAADLGYMLRLRDAVMVLTIGQIVGSLFFQFFGQLVGRTMVLASRGIPPAASIVLFGYERLFALLVSLGLAASGVIYLFGMLHFDLTKGGFSFLQVGIGITVTIVAGAWLAWGQQARRLWRGLDSRLVSRMGWTGLLSIMVQLTTLAAYIIAGLTLAPDIDLLSLAAASCVIMFAASLPVSFAGWGLRELSAVFVLQTIGFSSASALVTGLLIGVVSLLVVGLCALAVRLSSSSVKITMQAVSAAAPPDYTLALDWILPIAAANAVLFQIYLPTYSGNLSVNLADPVVLIGCSLYALRHVRTGWPSMRIPGIGLYLIAATAVIALSFVQGIASFGFTDWAFTNRFIGWGILICYAATGALIVERAHHEGYEVLLKTFVSTVASITLLNILMLALTRLGVESIAQPDLRIPGFSQNSNAFAFALLLALAATLALGERARRRTALLSIILTGIWYTGSRAGLGAGLAILVAAAWWSSVARRPILLSLGTAVFTILLVKFLPVVAGGLFHFDFTLAIPGNDRLASNAEHSESLWGGISLFLAHPIIGGGLGAYLKGHIESTGIALIIHSTPIWLLAETGVVGFAVFFAAVFQIAKSEFPRRHESPALMILLMLCGLAVMSSMHELLYQRPFWLLLGAALVYTTGKEPSFGKVRSVD